MTLNLSNAFLKFDTSGSGFPFTLGTLKGISAGSIHANIPVGNPDIPQITVSFTPGAFVAGTSVSFGIDRDYIGDGGGNSADIMEGGQISATTTNASLQGTFVNTYGVGYTVLDGFGLIDAVRAAQAVP